MVHHAIFADQKERQFQGTVASTRAQSIVVGDNQVLRRRDLDDKVSFMGLLWLRLNGGMERAMVRS